MKVIYSFHGGKLMKIILKVRNRGKRGYDISSIPFKKLERANNNRKKKWELKEMKEEKWLILESY